MSKGGDGTLFGSAGIEVPLPRCGGQGQVMHAREHVGPWGMACALGSPGVQGSSTVTLNQNRLLPFERPQGRRMVGQINTKVGSGGFRVPSELCHTCPQLYVCISEWKHVFVFTTSAPSISVIYLPHISLSQTPRLSLSFMDEPLSVCPLPFSSPPAALWVQLTAMWQIQTYDLRNGGSLNLYVAQCAAIPLKESKLHFCHIPCCTLSSLCPSQPLQLPFPQLLSPSPGSQLANNSSQSRNHNQCKATLKGVSVGNVAKVLMGGLKSGGKSNISWDYL